MRLNTIVKSNSFHYRHHILLQSLMITLPKTYNPFNHVVTNKIFRECIYYRMICEEVDSMIPMFVIRLHGTSSHHLIASIKICAINKFNMNPIYMHCWRKHLEVKYNYGAICLHQYPPWMNSS